MAKLSDEEQAQLDALTEKANAPEPEGGGRSEVVNVTIDLSDDNAVQRAIDHGFLTKAEADELKEGGEGGEDDEGDGKGDAKGQREKSPSRRSYFPK